MPLNFVGLIMLRISKLADYGTVIMSHLAVTAHSLFSAKEIAKAVHIAQPTVSKILKVLSKAQLVIADRGVDGGYQLARSPTKITVAEIITAIDGVPSLTDCCAMTKTCDQLAVCNVRSNWRMINQVVVTALKSLTLADMTKSVARHPVVVYSKQLKQKLLRHHHAD